ncbi:LysR family transcriptional regulator [Pseudorhodoferax sp. Leaf267]|nr:LysR family transcriptional regulator [Pseudorhodoferax sp. Leaf267]
MDTVRAMQTFVQIADAGSLTAAAQALDSSLPAVVRMLAAYEAHLQVRLFNRTTRRIALTDEGRRHLESCRQILAAIADAEAALLAEATEPAGLLTITAPVLFGQLHVAPAVTRFAQAHPQMQCRLLLADRVVNLLEENVDVGVRIGALADSSLVARRMGQIHRHVVAHPGLLRTHGTPQHPTALRQLPCVRVSGHAPGWGPFADGKRSLRVEVSGQLEFSEIGPAIDACAAGAGFGNFYSYQVAEYVRRRKLQIVLRDFEPPPQPIHLVYPHARLLPRRARVFLDWMREALQAFDAGSTAR